MYLTSTVRQFVFVVSFALFALLFTFIQPAHASTADFLPRADGNYTQWKPLSGTSHTAMVNETVCNGVTNYNSTTTVGSRDSYVVSTSSLPNGATISQIDIKPCASRDGTGTGTSVLNVFYRFGGVNGSDSGSYSFTSGNTPADQATTTFSGLALTKTSTTTLEIGGVYTSGTKGLRLSRIATKVTYTALAAPTALTASATTTSSIKLGWTRNSTNENGFAIDRSTDALNWGGLATTTASTTSYYDNGLSAGSTFYYRVRAFNTGAYTSYSNTATGTTLSAPPTAPSGLTATASTTKPIITLSWTDNSSNETAFEVLRSTDNINFIHVASTSANVATSSNSGLSTSTTYYYQVRAYNAAGYSSVSATASDTTSSVPAAASGLAAVASTTVKSIALTWTDNSSNELFFTVTRSTVATSSFTILATNLKSASYTDTNLSAGVTYYYIVTATNGYGTSTASNTDSATAANVPTAPSSLSLSKAPGAGTSTDVTVSWTDNSTNELAFAVERMSLISGYVSIATTTPDATSYVDAGLSPGTYTYRVRAYNGVGYSVYSNSATTTVLDNPPTAPSSLTATASTTNLQIDLAWSDNSSNETAFEVLRGTSPSLLSHLATTSANATSYSDTTILDAVTYYYQVRAYGIGGYSATSSTASATNTSGLQQGLVTYWTLDGTSTDATGNGHNGTDNAVTYSGADGIINSGAAMSAASSSFISVTDASDLKPTGHFTINGWMKTTNSGVSRDAVLFQSYSQNTNAAGIRFSQSSTKMQILVGKNTGLTDGVDYNITNSVSDLPDGVWHMWTAVYDGTYLTIYRDGILEASTTSSIDPAYAATNYVRIGDYNWTGTEFDTGDASVDEIGLWSKNLTPAEISTLYNSGSGRSYPF